MEHISTILTGLQNKLRRQINSVAETEAHIKLVADTLQEHQETMDLLQKKKGPAARPDPKTDK